VDDLLRYVITGIPLGCVYGLMAVGVVLTFRTAGVFNLAFGAQAFISAALLHYLTEEGSWPLWAGVAVALLVAAPLLGLVLNRAIFRHLRSAPPVARLVATLGLLVALPAIADMAFGSDPRYQPPSLAPDPDRVFHFASYTLTGDQVVAVVAALGTVALLTALLRLTPLGLQMRAAVESPRLVELAGIDAGRISDTSWVVSSLMAGLAGILLAPLFSTVDDLNFTILLVAAIAAGAVGRFASLPLALVGGIVLGIAQQILSGELPLDSVLAQGLRPSLPFIMLFAVLLAWPGATGGREVADPLAGVDPPPPGLAAAERAPVLDRLMRYARPLAAVSFLAVALFALSGYWLFLITTGVVLATVFLSITVLTGMGGLVSLCPVTFAGVGAFTAAQLAERAGVSVLVGMLVGGLVAAAVGTVVALPALRLGGVHLALATLAFALMVEHVVFPLESVSGGGLGTEVPRPLLGAVDFSGDRPFFVLALAVFGLLAAATILIRRGTTGRALDALRGSEAGAAAVGISPTRAKMTAFALSAGIAGIGGGLYASLLGRVSPGDFNVFVGLFWVVIVVTLGPRTVEGAFVGGLTVVLFPELLDGLGVPGAMAFVLFGLGAITFARHPEGIVEANKRSVTRWVNRAMPRTAAPA
jgi:ABC-type branched-subunit amino acid transport system permease subunit